MKRLYPAWLISALLFGSPQIMAQNLPSGMLVSNRLEYRLMEDGQETFDDLFDLDYSVGAFTAGLRLENARRMTHEKSKGK